MTTLAYLDCPTGIAGDMCLGALIDAGVPIDYLTTHLNRLGIAMEYRLYTEEVLHNGLRSLKAHVDLLNQTVPVPDGWEMEVDHHSTFDYSLQSSLRDTQSSASLPSATPVHASTHSHPNHSHSDHSHTDHSHTEHSHTDHSHSDHSHAHGVMRGLPEIEQMIRSAQLPEPAESASLKVFRQLAIAEAAVHGCEIEQVHFHEVGATDALVDIVGTCLGLAWLGIEQLYCSALPTGGGTLIAAHGRLPVPTPATLKLFEMGQVPVYCNGIQKELVTPTGAALVTALATAFGAPPKMSIRKVGLGAGSRKLHIPNMLRLWVGEATDPVDAARSTHHPHSSTPKATHPHSSSPATRSPKSTDQSPSESMAEGLETIVILETQVDDLNPQIVGYVFEELLSTGALDVFSQAIGMKKSRPGLLLTVLCPLDAIDRCETILFQETSTLGVRRRTCQRQILSRTIESVELPHGKVRVKVARHPVTQAVLNVKPEYEDCAAIARHQNLTWQSVYDLALRTWQQQSKPPHSAALTTT